VVRRVQQESGFPFRLAENAISSPLANDAFSVLLERVKVVEGTWKDSVAIFVLRKKPEGITTKGEKELVKEEQEHPSATLEA